MKWNIGKIDYLEFIRKLLQQYGYEPSEIKNFMNKRSFKSEDFIFVENTIEVKGELYPALDIARKGYSTMLYVSNAVVDVLEDRFSIESGSGENLVIISFYRREK